MPTRFLSLLQTGPVRAAQERYYGHSFATPSEDSRTRDSLGPAEVEFIRARDSFYLATISETGWPYLQHRGGAPGFLNVTDPGSLVFADYKGNRQMLSTGNLATNDRVALFLMDYPNRTRLKILGRARVEDARQRPDLLATVTRPEEQRVAERLFLIDVVAFDWNCPKYITPRYTAGDVQEAIAPLQRRIAELESQLARHRPATS